MRRAWMLAGLLILGADVPARSVTPHDTRTVNAPPARPVPLTAAQYDALRKLEQQPAHQARRDVPASYAESASPPDVSSRRESDLIHHGFQAGLPTLLLIILIAAAPL